VLVFCSAATQTPGSGNNGAMCLRSASGRPNTPQAAQLGRLADQGPERKRDAAVKQRCDRSPDIGRCERSEGVGRGDAGVHQHAGVAIAGHHTGMAGLALVGDMVEVEDRAQRLVPRLAAPDIEVPVEIEVFMAADAGDRLPLAADITRDFGERRRRVEHRDALFEPADRCERLEQFVPLEIDQV